MITGKELETPESYGKDVFSLIKLMRLPNGEANVFDRKLDDGDH